MQVNLKRKWFAPDGSLYEPTDNPHSFPDDWKGALPSTAKEVSSAKETEEDEDLPSKTAKR